MDSYVHVDVAVNGVQNRNKIHQVDVLDTWGKKLTDTYTTYFRYTTDMVDHVKETGSVKDFKGSAYSPWIPFDIDSKDLREAHKQLIQLLRNINKYGVSVDSCKIYFSGSKGFHVMLPSELVGVEPSEDIHMRFRNFTSTLAKGIKLDTSIYDKVKLFRLPNTINSKSGLYKIRLNAFEIQSLNTEEIKNLAVNPRKEWEPNPVQVNEELRNMYWSETRRSETPNADRTEGVRVKKCLHRMMQGVDEGNRDNIGLRVATHLKASGLSAKMIWAALGEWNEQNKPPLTEKEIERIFRQGLQQYEFGCNDPVLSDYCDKTCLFYKGR